MIRKWLKNKHSVTWTGLAPYAYTYILLPVVLYMAFWLRPVVGIPSALLMVAAGIIAINPRFIRKIPLIGNPAYAAKDIVNPLFDDEAKGATKHASLKGWIIVALFIIALLWCYFGGIGGFWAQSADWSARNAIFYDLIAKPWPVYYNGGASSLVYYINHWIPVAAPVHLLYTFTADFELCKTAGNILLLLWTASGVFLVELLMVRILKISQIKHLIIMVFLLVFFSGMDIVGIVARALNGFPDPAISAFVNMHLEWWAGPGAYQFSSNTTLLFWVFNQTVIPWICVCIVLLARNRTTFVLVFAACFAAGPYASMGLLIIMAVIGISALCRIEKTERIKTFLLEAFSPANILALIPIAVYAFYFSSNQSVSTTGQRIEFFGIAQGTSFWLLALFLFLEVGIYICIMHKTYCKKPVFWAVCAIFIIAPLVHFGSAYEFCCRATIPALFIMMIMVTNYLIVHLRVLGESIWQNKAAWILLLCLFAGMVTPVFEFSRGLVEVREKGIEAATKLPIDIEEHQVEQGAANNFKALVDEDGFFFKFIIGE